MLPAARAGCAQFRTLVVEALVIRVAMISAAPEAAAIR